MSHEWSEETIWVSGATVQMWTLYLRDGAMAGCRSQGLAEDMVTRENGGTGDRKRLPL